MLTAPALSTQRAFTWPPSTTTSTSASPLSQVMAAQEARRAIAEVLEGNASMLRHIRNLDGTEGLFEENDDDDPERTDGQEQ